MLSVLVHLGFLVKREREGSERGENEYLLLGSRRPSIRPWWTTVTEWVSVVVLPVAGANPRSDRGVGGVWLTVNLVRRAAGPPYLYIALRQGPTNQKKVGRPRSGRRSRVRRAVGLVREEINLTFSPLISTFTFNYVLFILLVSSRIGAQSMFHRHSSIADGI